MFPFPAIKKKEGVFEIENNYSTTGADGFDVSMCDLGNNLSIILYTDRSNNAYPTVQLVSNAAYKKVGNKVVLSSSAGAYTGGQQFCGQTICRVSGYNNKFACIYRKASDTNLYVVHGIVNADNTITLGTPTSISSGVVFSELQYSIDSLTTDTLLIAKTTDDTYNRADVNVATVSSSDTIDLHTWYSVYSVRTTSIDIKANGTTGFCVYVRNNANGYPYAVAATVSGTVITPGTAIVLDSERNASREYLAKIETDKFVCTIHTTTNVYYAVLSISGATVTSGGLVFVAAASGGYCITIASKKVNQFYLVWFDNYDLKHALYDSTDGDSYTQTKTGTLYDGNSSSYMYFQLLCFIGGKYVMLAAVTEGTNISLLLDVIYY